MTGVLSPLSLFFSRIFTNFSCASTIKRIFIFSSFSFFKHLQTRIYRGRINREIETIISTGVFPLPFSRIFTNFSRASTCSTVKRIFTFSSFSFLQTSSNIFEHGRIYRRREIDNFDECPFPLLFLRIFTNFSRASTCSTRFYIFFLFLSSNIFKHLRIYRGRIIREIETIHTNLQGHRYVGYEDLGNVGKEGKIREARGYRYLLLLLVSLSLSLSLSTYMSFSVSLPSITTIVALPLYRILNRE